MTRLSRSGCALVPSATRADRRKARWLLALLSASGLALGQPSDTLQARSWAAACTGCHGGEERAEPGMASLAGAQRESMFATLLDFKSGRLQATVMQQLARGYDDEQLRAIADYFSSCQPP